MDPTQIENRCDAADLMILRNGVFKVERVEQLLLPTLQSGLRSLWRVKRFRTPEMRGTYSVTALGSAAPIYLQTTRKAR